MDAAAAPLMVLKRRMAVHGLNFKPWTKERASVTPGKDWARIESHRKQASGCGDHGGKVLEGLTLYVRRGERADLNSFLCICLSDEARENVEAEFGGVSPGAMEDQTDSAKKTRTISYIGGSIQFVCIERRRSSNHGRNEPVVEVWTLDLDRRRWRKDQEGFTCLWREFQRQVRFMDDAEVSGVERQYPVLLPGGALCLVLANMRLRRKRRKGFVEESDYIYSFDMRSKKPLWFGLVRDYSTIDPVILPCDFFDHPSTHKRKLTVESTTRYNPNQPRRLSAREELK